MSAEKTLDKEAAMPIYEFSCHECKKDFEVVQGISAYDPKKVECPECHSKDVERRWSRVTAITAKKS